jgi:hypothetical protein
MQFPSAYYTMAKTAEPSGGNAILNTLFSNTFISNDIVLANEALIRHDRDILLGKPKYLQKYALNVLMLLAPNKDCRLPNFGRINTRKEKQEDTKHRGLHTVKDGAAGGRLTAKKKSNMLSLKKVSVVSSIIRIEYYTELSVF